jgi:hypothetical protein
VHTQRLTADEVDRFLVCLRHAERTLLELARLQLAVTGLTPATLPPDHVAEIKSLAIHAATDLSILTVRLRTRLVHAGVLQSVLEPLPAVQTADDEDLPL